MSDPAVIGAKAAGLLRLPQTWFPPFLFITSDFYNFWRVASSYSVVHSLLIENRALFDQLFPSSEKNLLYVRSNGPSETMSERGSSKSLVVENSLSKIATAVYDLLRRSQKTELPLIQGAIPGMLGHMSNERRVSAHPSMWLIESEYPINYIRIKTVGESALAPLMALTHKEVVLRLREVAGFLSQFEEERFHCEWIWDGKRVWIVQADMAQREMKGEVFSSWLALDAKAQVSLPDSFKVLLHFSSDEGRRFRKLRSPLLFRKVGMPTADIFLLTGERWAQSLVKGSDDLVHDLHSFGGADLVIRCDVSLENDDLEYFLPLSEPTRSIGDILQSMAVMSSHLHSRGLDNTEWTFLLNVLVPSKVGAFVHAFPGSKKVRVDALWGSPDGLSYFPHDTYLYSPVNRKVKSRVRYKGVALLPAPKWNAVSVSPPFDWRRVLSDQEVIELGDWGLSVAQEVGHEIQLMAFARVGGRRGVKGCLPWHFTVQSVPFHRGAVPHIPNDQRLKVISNYEELSFLESAEQGSSTGFVVRPASALLRDSEFLRSIGRLAATKGMPLYFEGSLLGHAYYILANSGALVVPVFSETEPQELPERYHKLVRDRVPAIIQRSGGIPRVRSLSRSEAKVLLAQKILEEAFEVWESTEISLPEELADLLEVIEAFCKNIQMPFEKVEAIREQKRKERGGFEDLVFLEETISRTLGDTEGTEGVIPLLYDDFQSYGARGKKVGPLVCVSQAVHGSIDLKLPLIPPVSQGQALAKIGGVFEGLEVSAHYQGAKVELSIRRKVYEDDNGQLTLFPDFVPD